MQDTAQTNYTPNQNDVLAGRGCGSQLYPGNVQFRNVVNKMKRQYNLMKGNKQKNEVAFAVVQEIRSMDPPGRFLCKTANGNWTLQDEKSVLVKTKQALRERPSPRSTSPKKKVYSMDALNRKNLGPAFNFEREANEIGSFSVTRHFSDFRSFLISERLYLKTFASDSNDQIYIEKFLDMVFFSLTWRELAQKCNYFYEDNKVEAFLKAIWQLYPFLGEAYYFDKCSEKDSSSDINIFRKKTGKDQSSTSGTPQNEVMQ